MLRLHHVLMDVNEKTQRIVEEIKELKRLAGMEILQQGTILKPLAYVPKELDTDEAKALLKKVIELELCVSDGNLYQWKGTPSLLGYFVDIVSDYLNVRPSNGRLPWKLFKTAFQCSDTDIATAKQAVNDYKNKSQSEPEGFLYIKNICK